MDKCGELGVIWQPRPQALPPYAGIWMKRFSRQEVNEILKSMLEEIISGKEKSCFILLHGEFLYVFFLIFIIDIFCYCSVLLICNFR